jgi:23S rRNA-/tRNA-specific pseudouridylate synthase
VHRLDKDTTGVMVVAKNDIAHRHLSQQFADHGRTMPLERAYQAIVWGRPRSLTGTSTRRSAATPATARERAVKRPGTQDADEAITHYEVLERFHEKPDATSLASLVECHLETGRTHQIRVHMAHIGHPLLGDTVYGAAFQDQGQPPARSGKEGRQRLPPSGAACLICYSSSIPAPAKSCTSKCRCRTIWWNWSRCCAPRRVTPS